MKTSTRSTGPATDNGYHICWPPLFRAGTPKLMVNPAPPKNVGFLPSLFRRFDRRLTIATDSHKTDGNPEHRTACRKRMAFRFRPGNHLSVVIWRVREKVRDYGKAA